MLLNEGILDNWVRGNSHQAMGVIADLLYRLVAASSPNPTERRFQQSDSIGQHGADGWLDGAMKFEPFVPEGKSWWELGVGHKPGDKATSDYRESIKEVPEDVRLQTTFIFVTPLSASKEWEFTWKEDAQSKWLAKQRKKQEWKDVRIIDGTRLIDWILHFPAIELWLIEIINGQPVKELREVSKCWKDIESIGYPPPLTPKIFTINRESACEKIDLIIKGTITQLKIETHFPDQMADFACAFISSKPKEDRIEITGRSIVVLGASGWELIAAHRQPLW